MPDRLPRNALTPKLWSTVAAILVLFAGFGVLNLLTVLGAGRSDLPGLYTFRSATVGDGILLPTLAYALVRAGGWHRGWAGYQRRFIAGAAMASAASGVAVQASWLLTPDPRLNWTLPAPHQFNGPGWYHAVFLVLACGFFGGAATALWLRVRAESRAAPGWPVRRIRSVGALAVLGPGPAFVALLALDDPSSSVAAIAGTLAVSGTLAVLLVRSATPTVELRWTASIILASLMPAAAVGTLLYTSSQPAAVTVLPVLVAGLAGAYGCAVLRSPHGADRLVIAVTAATVAAAPVHLATAPGRPSVAALCLAAGASLALTIAHLAILRAVLDDPVPWLRLLAVPTTMVPVVAIAMAGRYLSEEKVLASAYANVLTAVAGLLILGIAARGVRSQFDPVIDAEVADSPELSALRWQAYLAIGTAFAGALLASVTFVIGTSQTGQWTDGSRTAWPTIIGMLAALALLLAAIWGSSMRAGPTWRLLAPAIAAVGCLGWTATVCGQLLAGFATWYQTLFAVGPALVSGLFVLESVISNTGRLHNQGIRWQTWLIGASAGLSVTATTAWMVGPALQSGAVATTVGTALACLGIAAAANITLPFLAARSIPGAYPARRFVIGVPITGVRQDSFVAVVLVVSIGWVPSFFFAHLTDVGASWGAVFSYLALLSAAYVWVMKNNVTHFTREYQRLAAQTPGCPLPADSARALVALRRHIIRQNALAIVALVPLGIFLLISEITGFDDKGIRQLLRVHPVAPH